MALAHAAVRELGTVARAVAVMRLVAEADPDVSLSQIAHALELPVSTVHRLLHLLVDEGIVEQRSRHAYAAGAEFFRIGALVTGRISLASIARPFMQELVEACDEYCLLCLYLPAERKIMVADTVSSSHPLSYIRDRFVPISPAWGATGRSILAHLPESEIVAVHAAAGPSPASGRKLPPLPEFLAELARIRARGYAHTRGQKVAGAVGFGTALFQGGRVVASLCLTVPEFRYRARSEPGLARALMSKAAGLNRVLGTNPDADARSARFAPARQGPVKRLVKASKQRTSRHG